MIDKDLQSASFQSVPYFDKIQLTFHMQWKHVLTFHQYCHKIKYYFLHVVETEDNCHIFARRRSSKAPTYNL